MFKKIIDAIVAFFKGPAPHTVVAAAPYKIETPAESVAVTIAMTAPIVKEPTPALTVVKPKAVKAAKPAAKPLAKPAVKAVPAAKKAPVTKADPKSTLRKAADVPAKPKAPGRAKPKAVK